MGIFSKTIIALFHIVANFNDIHSRKTSVDKAHMSRKNIWTLLRAHIEMIKTLQGSTHLSKTRFCYFSQFQRLSPPQSLAARRGTP